ncbi:MAG: hypothetical protein ACEQSK_10175 [Sphingomonadaceae bacterium]
MIFIETPQFMQSIDGWLADDALQLLQQTLLDNPETGALLRGGGGIRK